MKKNYIFGISLLFLYSCSFFEKDNEKVVRVFDKYLYINEISSVIPDGTSPDDSLVKAKSFIDMWVQKQLLLKKAELNLDDEQKDVEKQLEDYRTSLLIFKYKQLFLQQKLDTIISLRDIESYYQQHSADFLLQSPAIKGFYAKLLKTDPNIDNLKYWLESRNVRDIQKLKDYCLRRAVLCETFKEDWTLFENILKDLKIHIPDVEKFLKTEKKISVSDSAYQYFVFIKEFRLKNQTAPLNFVKNYIESILLNKRKNQLINELENNIYQNALNQNNVEYFEKKKK